MEELSRKQKNKHDHRFTTWLKNIIFGIVMIAPFLSVMARTIYVQSNPNAMQSYSGNTEMTYYEKVNKYTSEEVTYMNELTANNAYYLTNFNSDDLDYFAQNYGGFEVEIYLLATDTIDANFINGENEIYDFNLNDNFTYIYLYFDDDVAYKSFTTYIGQDSYMSFEIDYLYIDYLYCHINVINDNNVDLSSIEINELFELRTLTDNELSIFSNYYQRTLTSSNLDNAFDYSLKSFVEDNNYGFNFFSWFGDMFLNQSGNNMIYLNFINWYLNYGLLISVAYIFFLILLWFINLSRRILDRLMNFDGGGY